MPNIWEAILEAGGPQQNAQLDRVQLIRGGETGGKITEIDLTAAFERGEMQGLPALMPGDNIYVPVGQSGGVATAAGGAQSATGGGTNLFSRKQSVYVFGQVVMPGVYQIEKDMDVLQAIVQAGGPAYPNRATTNSPLTEPDLEHVKIITRGPEAPVVYSVNVEKYTNVATPIPLILKPGDTVFVPGKQSYRRFILTSSAVEVIKASVAVVTSYLLLNRLFGQGR
jgi:protein involved in polysaccharide export with SLBB domain